MIVDIGKTYFNFQYAINVPDMNDVSMAPVTEVNIQKPTMVVPSPTLPLDDLSKDLMLDEDNVDDGLNLQLSEEEEETQDESKLL